MNEGSSFSGFLTRVEIGHIRIGSAGNGLIGSLGFARRSVADVGICREYQGEIELSALTRTPVGLGGTHPSGPGTKQRMLGNPLPIMMYHTTALPTGLPAFTITASSGTSHHRPSIGTQ